MKTARISRFKESWRNVEHEVFFAIAIIVYIADVTSDVTLGVTYLHNYDIWHGSLTLMLVFISHFVFSVNMVMFISVSDGECIKKLLLCNLKYMLLPSPILLIVLWKIKTKTFKRERQLKFLSLLRKRMALIELFFESIPQVCLQAYIIISTQGYITTLQTVTCCISLFTASLGSANEFNGLMAKCFVFVTNIFWLFTRIIAIAMLGCIQKYLPFLFVLANFAMYSLLDCYERQESATRIVIGPLFSLCCTFSPLFSLRTFEVATFLTLANGIAFVISANFGFTNNFISKEVMLNTTTQINITVNTLWVNSINDSYLYQHYKNTTMSSKQDTPNVVLRQWKYFKPLSAIFIAFSILAILPLAVNFLLLVKKCKYHFVLKASTFSNKSYQPRVPKLLKKLENGKKKRRNQQLDNLSREEKIILKKKKYNIYKV